MSDHFDPLHRWYRSIWGDHLHHGWWLDGTETLEQAKCGLVREVASRAGINEASRTCDVGCGYGGTARMLVEEFGAQVTGVTDSSEQFRILTELGLRNPGFLRADWLDHPLPDGAFDVVLAIESTPHFTDPARGISEMARVLACGGRLAISTWVAAESPSWFARVVLLDPIRRAGAMPGLSGGEALIRWVRAAGLVLVSCERIGTRVRRTWRLCAGGAVKAWWRDGGLRWESFRHPLRTISLAVSLMRIRIAYALGILDYVVIVAQKP